MRTPLALAFLVMMLLVGRTADGQGPVEQAWRETAGVLQSTPVDAGGYTRFRVLRTDLRIVVGNVPIPAARPAVHE